MEAKILNIKGLNTRANNIAQDESALIDCLNVFKDTNGNIRQTQAFEDRGKTNGLNPCWSWSAVDGYYIKKTGMLLVFCQEGVFSVQLNALSDLTAIQITTAFKYTSKLSFAEFGDTVYIADPSGANDLCKFDGRYYYRTGVPQSKFSVTAAGAVVVYKRAILYSTDYNGNIFYGDYSQQRSTTVSGSPVNVAVVFPSGQFCKYGDISVIDIRGSIDPTSTTLTFTATNFVAGDVVWMTAVGPNEYGDNVITREVKMTVTNVAGLAVTFSYSLSSGESIGGSNAVSTVRCLLASSRAATYGYNTESQKNLGISPTAANVFASPDYDGLTILSSDVFELEDVYDSTVVKGMPKKFKYISAFNNQMVGIYDQNKVAWSDLGVGSTVETFAPFDYEVIGKSDEGEVTGVFCSTDHIVVFKKEDIFFLFGQLYGRQYRIVKSTTTGIGCISHSSIAPYSGGCVFLSEKGLYFTANGGLPEELSDIVEPTITGYSAKDRSYIYFDYPTERMFICFNDGNMELDYYWKDWFKSNVEEQAVWSAWTPYGRHFIRNELSLTIRKESSTEKPISCYIQTAWQSNQTPELDKKFVSVSAINGYGDSFKLKFDTYYNWSSISDGASSREISSIPIAKASCPAKTAKSASFRVSKDGVSEDFIVSGLFYEVEQRQERIKDR